MQGNQKERWDLKERWKDPLDAINVPIARIRAIGERTVQNSREK